MSYPGLNRTQVLQVVGVSFYDKTEMDAALAGKASTAHTHDDRYFTEAEVTSLLAGKSDTSHNHDSDYAALVHTHDDRYFTESEITSLLSGKSDTGHNHDAIYAALAHAHAAADVISGVFDNARINWAAPGAIGGTTPAAGSFSTIGIGSTSSPARGLAIYENSAETNSILDVLKITRLVNGTPANGHGAAIHFEGEDSLNSTITIGRIKALVSAVNSSQVSAQMVFSVRARNDALGSSGVERDVMRLGSVAGSYKSNVQFPNSESDTSWLLIKSVHSDGRMGIMSYADGAEKQVFTARGANLGLGHGGAGASTRVSIAGINAHIACFPSGNTVISSLMIGSADVNSGTHKSLAFSTPEQTIGNMGTWTRTDTVDLFTGSWVSNSPGGVRPNMRYTALEHVFRVDGTTGANNPGTEVLRVKSGEIDVTGTLHGDGLRIDVTPTAETIVCTHTLTISANGVNYKIPMAAV